MIYKILETSIYAVVFGWLFAVVFPTMTVFQALAAGYLWLSLVASIRSAG